MSDPYHTYDNHNIQINVFHIKEPLKGTLIEKDKQMHSEAYLFNSKDPQKPEINFPKKDIKLIKDNLYLSDTIEIVYRKIGKMMDLPSNEIYAWIDHKREKKSLLCTKPLGINYDDLDDCEFMNPYLIQKVDDRFVNSDGSPKRNGLTYLERYKILNTQIVDEQYNIYFTTLKDVIEYSTSIFKEDEKMIKYGYLKKYFPLLDEKIFDDLIDTKIELINSQKEILSEYDSSPVDIRPIHLLYENKSKNMIIDLFKIFQEYQLSIDVPMLKIQTDNYMDSYIKFYKDGINTSYSLSIDKNITSEIFEKWNKNIYLSDGFSRPKGIDKNNSLTFTIYDKKTLDNIQMILYIDGKIQVYSERFNRLDAFTDNIIQGYLHRCNSIIKSINRDLIVSIPEIIKKPVRIDISSIYEISDYHLLSLKKLFGSFYTQFILLTDDDDKLHLLYRNCDDFENMKYITDTITLCKRKKILEKDIIEILMNRYGLNKTKSKEYLDEWTTVNMNNPIRYREEIKNISIIIEKVLDRIKVSFYGLYNYSSFHECIDNVNRIMNIYKQKRVDKRKDLPEPIEKLFKKTVKNIIITSQLVEPIIGESEPEPDGDEPSETPETEVIEHTDEIIEEEDESEEDESEDEYEDIDDDLLAGMKGGSFEGGTDESKYPNSRYYIKRLEMKDPRLIKYKGKSSRDGYAAKCQAAQDKQPIALTNDELLEIDTKTGFKNLGVSYSKPIKIVGSDRDDIYYICPKFWDRKHQIPIDPKSKYHPIEKDEDGNPLEWKQFVWSKEYKNTDGDYFILERSGRSAGKGDSSSYWNKDKNKDNIDKYQVQLIHDDVHPELLALPCCGKKQYKITKKEVNVLIKDKNGKNIWVNGVIKSDSELQKLNDIQECKINIGTKKDDTRIFHISQIKEKKGHTVSTNISDYTDFPLKEDNFGRVNNIIKDIFYMRPNAPFIKKSSAKKDIEMGHNGFFRKGVIQDSDAFLRCLETLRKPLFNKNRKYSLKDFKTTLLSDIENLSYLDIFNIGNGSFVQYFRSEKIYDKQSYEKDIISDVKENLKSYIYSGEPKDHKLLIPLLMKCSEKTNNKLFNNLRINILVLSESYEKRGDEIINTKLKLSEPLGGLTIYEGEPYLLIYQKDDYYESLMYYYNGNEYSNISNIRDDEPIRETDIIYIKNEIAEIKGIKDGVVKILYDNGSNCLISSDECIKYDMSIIYKILTDFINGCRDKSIHNKKEIINFEDLEFIMHEKFNSNPIEGYYDNYNKLVCILYKKEKSSFKIPLFIKPRNKDDINSFPLKKIKSMDNYSLPLILRTYSQIDKYINEIYPDKHLLYINDKCKIIVNDFNLTIGLFMENGFIIPLKHIKYNESFYRYATIKGSSLLSLQINHINPFAIKDQIDTYFHKYNEKNETIYKSFSELYDNIMKNRDIKLIIKKIVNHPIKLNIHKRWDLYDLLKDLYNEKRYKNLKIFIEYLLIHDLNDLHKILFQNYSSLKDYKMNMKSSDSIVLTMKEYLTESYLELFEKHSEYIRNISYYEYSNPNVNKTLLKRESIEKPVSSYSKYPNTLKKIFGKEITIYKNIISEDRNDINIISRLLDDVSLERIRGILIDIYSEDDDSFKLHNVILGDIYKDNRELLSSISSKFYKLSLIDYEILSEKLEIGFVLFSNRYSNDFNRYKTHMIIHKSLKDVNESDIKTLCLYEDISEEISENTECKPISIKDKLIHVLGDLRKNREFNRLYLKS